MNASETRMADALRWIADHSNDPGVVDRAEQELEDAGHYCAVYSCLCGTMHEPCPDQNGIPLCASADARLIAAAPHMLAALKDIVARNEIQHWFNLDKARAAIAKAEGRK